MAALDAVAKDLQEQWDLLRAWLQELPVSGSAQPSTIPGWSVGDLIAHLGRGLDALTALTPVAAGPSPDDGTIEPLTLSEYLATYQAGAEQITAVTKELAAQIADDPLEGLDRIADRAFAHLRELQGSERHEQGEQIVLARRGPIRLADFAMTRLIELVVHAYDLAPELPLPVPVDPTARTLVANALIQVVRRRTGAAIEVGDEAAWIKAATGRIDWSAAVAAGAVRPDSLSDGTPDLTESLPLL